MKQKPPPALGEECVTRSHRCSHVPLPAQATGSRGQTPSDPVHQACLGGSRSNFKNSHFFCPKPGFLIYDFAANMKILFRASKADLNFLPLCRASFTRSRDQRGGVAPCGACRRESCPVRWGSLCWRVPDAEVSSPQVRSERGTGEI